MSHSSSASTGQTYFSAARRSAQLLGSAGGPAAGSRRVIYATARHSSSVAIRPGTMPAMNSLPMLVSVMMP